MNDDDDILKNDTRLKLIEAEHFLSQIKSSYFEVIENDTTRNFIILRSNFSAFISAARSITYFMQKQYAHALGFIEWYESEQHKMIHDQELSYLHNARVESIHIKVVPLGKVREAGYSLGATIVSQEERTETMRSKEAAEIEEPKTINSTTTSKTVALFLPKVAILNGKQVRIADSINLITFCERQFNKLDILVNECEKNFRLE